jgi:hypothetical protein
MSERKWWHLTFSEKSRKSRKILAIFLLILVVLGYLAFFALNAYIIASTLFIRLSPQGFTSENPEPDVMILNGTFLLDNSHWNSIDITDFDLDYTLYANDTLIIQQERDPITIPRQKQTNVSIDLSFNASEMTSEQFNAINSSSYLIFDVSLSFKYFLFGFFVNVKLNTSLLGG